MKKILLHYKESLTASIILLLFALLLHPYLTAIDNSFIDYRFNNRGVQPVDSSIVLLTFNDDDLQRIGGHAKIQAQMPLLLTALNDLGARVIGFDIILDELDIDRLDHPEGILPTLSKHSTICLAVLNKSAVQGDLPFAAEDIKALPEDTPANTLSISNASAMEHLLPASPRLLNAASGLGHNNFVGERVVRRVPMAIQTREMGLIPAFSLEIVRLYHGLPKDSIQYLTNSVVLHGRTTSIKIPTTSNKMLINYAGGREHVKTESALAFLKSYINFLTGHTPAVPLTIVKDKIVLVGLDSHVKGRSLNNPFHHVLPVVFLQANAVNTILTDSFIYSFPDFITYLLVFGVVFIIAALFLYGKPFRALVISLAIFGGYLLVSFFLFFENILLPIHPALMALPTIFLILLYKFGASERTAQNTETSSHSGTSGRISSASNKKDSTLENFKSNPGEQTTLSAAPAKSPSFPAANPDSKNNDDVHEIFRDINFDKTTRTFNGLYFRENSRFKPIVDMITKVAPSNAPVLVTGESGTGKELAARAIHDNSPRKDKNFVALNCASIQESLLESELFGHEKGAFTGADTKKVGLFEVADGGTVFLDEIAEMSDPLQSKLLRVLQFHEFYRVGGISPVKVDVRLVAATNKTPELQLEQGLLRKDLYYRISTIRIHMSPLHERREDIPILIQKFLTDEHAAHFDISSSAYKALMNFYWPGNIRQLQSVILHAVIFAKAEGTEKILLSHLPDEISKSAQDDQDLEQRILDSLRLKKFSHRSMNETARELGGLNRSTVTGYLRGISLRTLSDCEFDIIEASRQLSGDGDAQSLESISKKIQEYLGNLSMVVNKNRNRDDLVEYLQKKYKNIPKRYHPYLAKTVQHVLHSLQNDGKS